HAAHALRDQVVAAARGVWAGIAEAADLAIDQSRIDLFQRFVTESQALRYAGPVILDKHIHLRRQAPHDLDALGRLEVHGEAALAAVHRHEGRAVAVLLRRAQLARRLALARRLDLDHVGAHVGEVHGAERRRHGLREVDHADALQGLHEMTSLALKAFI